MKVHLSFCNPLLRTYTNLHFYATKIMPTQPDGGWLLYIEYIKKNGS